MSDKELVIATITALAAIDAELGLPEDGCNSTARTLTAIRLLHSVHRDDVAEIERLHEQMERGAAALRVEFGEELWRLGHPAYVVVHLRDEIERLSAEVARLTKENDWLRAYTAQSAKDCVYCGLGADEQGKCERGFPGCARGDDQMLCREVDVALERDELRAEVVSLRKQIAALESHEVCTAAHDHTETCGYCQRDALAQDAARYRWLRTAGAVS